MPISKYFGGHGTEVMKNMVHQYGEKKGKSVFYATANKRKSKGIPGERDNETEAQNIKKSIQEEHEAIDAYTRRGDQTNDPKLKKVYAHAKSEEKEHAAAFKAQISGLKNKVLNFDPKMTLERGEHTHEADMEKEHGMQGSLSKKFTTQYLMGSVNKGHADAKPITTDDMKMSDEHKRRRKEIDQIGSHMGRMKASIKYNDLHMREHAKALTRSKQMLANHIHGKLISKYLGAK